MKKYIFYCSQCGQNQGFKTNTNHHQSNSKAGYSCNICGNFMAKDKEQAPIDESLDFSDVDGLFDEVISNLDEYAEELQASLEALEIDEILENLGGDEDKNLFDDDDDIDDLFADEEEINFDYILS